ncbi:YitT family protein [Hymenobacter sp. 5516J-16]|uniref:YitT family protein n=1 Tax=Hymenobacter sublimis TaxID=2933777 RepID=A0ABY4JAX7_9BACT|nr:MULTISPECIES: YitT family protein [Hymenobacter]UOQ76300.1 YitT family protein [Hymenobacter sp. 5516J-16]UPL49972.1 YitT family protein [Hymenobacter sublimis]
MLLPQLMFLRKLRSGATGELPRRRRPAPGARPAKDRRWWRRQVGNSLLMVVGVFSAGFGLESFLLPSGFLDGGVTGVSLLITRVFGLPLPVLIVLLNLPFVLMAWRQLDPGVAIRTLLGILGLALVLAVVPFPIVTNDKLLISVFGGFFLGAGIGLAMRGGGVLDGTEIMAIYLSKQSSMSVGDIILVFNILIFGVAAWVLSMETALYSILAYLSAAKTIDFIIDGLEEYTGVTIVSGRSDAIRRMITEKLGRGATVYNGKRGFGTHGQQPNPVDIVFTVITRLEVSKLKAEVEQIDRQAFMVMHSVRDTKGGMIKKRPLH